MKGILIFAAFLGMAISIHLKVENTAYLKRLNSLDSINVYLTNKSALDSILLRELCVLTTGEKYDEIKMIYKKNNRVHPDYKK